MSRRACGIIHEEMPGDTLERARGIIARYLNVGPESIGEDIPLTELGLDSLGALEVVFEIEEAFHISIPDERVAQFTTLRVACDAIEALRRDTSPSAS
jgi:acyl carrier protein